MKFTAEDFHYIQFPTTGTEKFWESVAKRANEKLAEKQRATPDPRAAQEVELLKRIKELEERLSKYEPRAME